MGDTVIFSKNDSNGLRAVFSCCSQGRFFILKPNLLTGCLKWLEWPNAPLRGLVGWNAGEVMAKPCSRRRYGCSVVACSWWCWIGVAFSAAARPFFLIDGYWDAPCVPGEALTDTKFRLAFGVSVRPLGAY